MPEGARKPFFSCGIDFMSPKRLGLERQQTGGFRTGTFEFFFESGQRAVRAAEILRRKDYGYALIPTGETDAEIGGRMRNVEQYDLALYSESGPQEKIGTVEILRDGRGTVESIFIGISDQRALELISRFEAYGQLS
jgi:hypothetical protein